MAYGGINSMFARLGTDYETKDQWFFAILEAMTTGYKNKWTPQQESRGIP